MEASPDIVIVVDPSGRSIIAKRMHASGGTRDAAVGQRKGRIMRAEWRRWIDGPQQQQGAGA
jgi:hypothetical protein